MAGFQEERGKKKKKEKRKHREMGMEGQGIPTPAVASSQLSQPPDSRILPSTCTCTCTTSPHLTQSTTTTPRGRRLHPVPHPSMAPRPTPNCNTLRVLPFTSILAPKNLNGITHVGIRQLAPKLSLPLLMPVSPLRAGKARESRRKGREKSIKPPVISLLTYLPRLSLSLSLSSH